MPTKMRPVIRVYLERAKMILKLDALYELFACAIAFAVQLVLHDALVGLIDVTGLLEVSYNEALHDARRGEFVRHGDEQRDLIAHQLDAQRQHDLNKFGAHVAAHRKMLGRKMRIVCDGSATLERSRPRPLSSSTGSLFPTSASMCSLANAYFNGRHSSRDAPLIR